MSTFSLDVCRDRYGVFNVTFFQLWACSLCYNYIFHGRPLKQTHNAKRVDEVLPNLGPNVPGNILLYGDLFYQAMTAESPVCQELGDVECRNLNKCCQAANSCCSSQIAQAQASRYNVVTKLFDINSDLPTCPSTWDGFACFPETPAGQSADISCPSYIKHRNTDDGIAVKSCSENGTWWIDPFNGREWTDYTGCVPLQDFKPLYIVGITCNVISLLYLIPSCIIFLRFKQLRRQHRIRIHLNLFASFILTNCSWLAWDQAIFRDRAENGEPTVLMQQHAGWCRVLYVITRYTWACNFFWMSLEGFHLYRVINHAFKTPRSIKYYYVFGWLAPCIPLSLYCVLRIWNKDSGCWIYHAGSLEWIMYGPNLMCIVINVAFLVSVLRILLTQLQSHPNEPSNYRRALKATFILVPLFGIQLFLIVYRPYDNILDNISFEIAAKIIGNSQGAAVATVFCFFNSEVHSVICNGRAVIQAQNSKNDFRSCTHSTTAEHHRLDHTRMTHDGQMETIPLRCTRNGYTNHQGLGSDSPAISIQWNNDSDSRINML